MWTARRTLMVAAVLAWTSMSGCSDSATSVADATTPAGVGGGGGGDDHRGGNGSEVPTLIQCASTTTQTKEATISLLGGTITLGGTQVILSPGSLLSATKLVLTVPASPYMEIDVSVPGVDHFLFERAIVVVIDYSRCDPSVTQGVLSAWHIDSDTKEPLERMPGIDDKINRRVVFTTGHLSGYALAN